MHIKDNKVADNGSFVLSIDKNLNEFIDTDTREIKIYPDTPDAMAGYIQSAGLTISNQYETEFHIFLLRLNRYYS